MNTQVAAPNFNTMINSPGTRDAFERVLPKHIDVDTFISVCQTAVLGGYGLAKCSSDSIINAAMKCAEDQLLPDGRQAAFVNFGGQCVYMPMVAGILKRLKEQGGITSVICHCVYEKDEFVYFLGDEPRIEHQPTLKRRGEIIAAYAIFKNGDEIISREVMTVDEINQVRNSSKSSSSGPWESFYDEMARKSVIRRGAKRVIHSDKGMTVLDRDKQFYNFEQPKNKTILTVPPSVKHLELEVKLEPKSEIQGEAQPKSEPEVATEDDIPINPETVLSNLKGDLERAQDLDDVDNAWASNQTELDALPKAYISDASKLFKARQDELEGAA